VSGVPLAIFLQTVSATMAMWQAVDDTLIVLMESLAVDFRKRSGMGFDSFRGEALGE